MSIRCVHRYSEGHIDPTERDGSFLRSRDLDTVDDPRRSMMKDNGRPELSSELFFARSVGTSSSVDSSLNGAGRPPCPGRGNADK